MTEKCKGTLATKMSHKVSLDEDGIVYIGVHGITMVQPGHL